MTDSDQCTQRAELNRRHSSRTFGHAQLNCGRRRATRTHLFDEVHWRSLDDPRCRRGILVGVSGAGVALVTEHDHQARAGMQITLSKKGRNRGWREPVLVTIVDRLSDLLDLVVAEYSDPAPAIAWKEAAAT